MNVSVCICSFSCKQCIRFCCCLQLECFGGPQTKSSCSFLCFVTDVNWWWSQCPSCVWSKIMCSCLCPAHSVEKPSLLPTRCISPLQFNSLDVLPRSLKSKTMWGRISGLTQVWMFELSLLLPDYTCSPHTESCTNTWCLYQLAQRSLWCLTMLHLIMCSCLESLRLFSCPSV